MNYVKDDSPKKSLESAAYRPMRDIIPAVDEGVESPVNPSDSNVFRLHKLFRGLEPVAAHEINHFYKQASA